MNLRTVVALWAFAIVPCQIAAQSSAQGSLVTLRVHVYNLANVQTRIMESALGETARILALSGIEIVCEPGDADSPEAHTQDMTASVFSKLQKPDVRDFLVVRIVGGFPAENRRNALGYSLPYAREGVHVTVFYDRIEKVSSVVGAAVQAVLGSALAHEIGHVLLRSGEHTQSGIMKAVWSRSDYRHMAARPPEFEPAQVGAMRDEVLRRAGMQTISASPAPGPLGLGTRCSGSRSRRPISQP
jgi:hypothetical protein